MTVQNSAVNWLRRFLRPVDAEKATARVMHPTRPQDRGGPEARQRPIWCASHASRALLDGLRRSVIMFVALWGAWRRHELVYYRFQGLALRFHPNVAVARQHLA